MIRTHASFDMESDDLDEESPPGKDIADRLVSSLTARRVDCFSLGDLESAYEFEAATPEGSHWVTFGYVGGDGGRQWLVLVAPQRRGVLRRRDDPASLVAVLHQVLVEDLETQPQWFTDAEWNNPHFGRGQPTPTS